MSDTKLFKTPSTNLTGSIPSSMYGNSGASFGTAFTSLNYLNDQNLIFQLPSPDNTSYISRTNYLLNSISFGNYQYTNASSGQLQLNQQIVISGDASSNRLDISAPDTINLTATTGNIKITPTKTISTTSVPYGLYLDSPLIKTYPITTSFSAYPLYRTTAELGTNQTYPPSISTGFNFIYGDSRSYTKSAGTTSDDIERLFFTGFEQSFNWTDVNTCKQYLGINDSFTYSGINANTRVSSIFRADSITLNCPTSYTQTITNIRCRDFRINASNANATYNITNSISTNLTLVGNATNVIANISNHSFFENSSSWDVSLNVVGGSLATITNMYGLRLHPPNGQTTTGLTITNNWGIYSGWDLAKNYFAGGVGIGTTSISNALDISGNAIISTSLKVPKITNTASIELAPDTTTGDLILTGINLQSSSAGGNSGQHLRIKLNGVYYKIKLEID
jgi:hypothetical protein